MGPEMLEGFLHQLREWPTWIEWAKPYAPPSLVWPALLGLARFQTLPTTSKRKPEIEREAHMIASATAAWVARAPSAHSRTGQRIRSQLAAGKGMGAQAFHLITLRPKEHDIVLGMENTIRTIWKYPECRRRKSQMTSAISVDESRARPLRRAI